MKQKIEIVCDFNPESFKATINRKLEAGWELQGPMIVRQDGALIQMMWTSVCYTEQD